MRARPQVVTATAAAAPVVAPPAKPVLARRDRVVRSTSSPVGVSTGGPNALAELLPLIKGDLPVPIVLVQHMPPMFTRLLAEQLNCRRRSCG